MQSDNCPHYLRIKAPTYLYFVQLHPVLTRAVETLIF